MTTNFLKGIDWDALQKQKEAIQRILPLPEDLLSGLVELIDKLQDCNNQKQSETKIVGLCHNCNSDNVQVKRWVNINTFDVGDCIDVDDDEDMWCEDCEGHHGVYGATLKSDAKIIGYQVVTKEHTPQFDGDIHPDMDASFCVYSLSQANEMLEKNSSKYKLSAIWEGDIEDPTIMFEGDVRD